MKKISVLTIVHNREKALVNLIDGLNQSHLMPAELVLIYMNEKPYTVPKTSFPLVEQPIHHSNQLPLAQARNRAVEAASYDDLVFLDVDCIPHRSMLGHYANAFEQDSKLWSGQVRYLHQNAVEEADFWHRLDELSKADPIRTSSECLPYHLFWSLNFGCSKQTFDQIGRFDEGYGGYGAEDTDFAFSARQAAVPLAMIPALAYHQYHTSYDPPLNHLRDIIANATFFKKKWHVWPMEGWLAKFQQRGFIHWTKDHIQLLREPSTAELLSALKE